MVPDPQTRIPVLYMQAGCCAVSKIMVPLRRSEAMLPRGIKAATIKCLSLVFKKANNVSAIAMHADLCTCVCAVCIEKKKREKKRGGVAQVGRAAAGSTAVVARTP